MATIVDVSLALSQDKTVNGAPLPVVATIDLGTEILTAGATSVPGALVAAENQIFIVSVPADATKDVRVKFASSSPSVTTTTGKRVLRGTTRFFGADAGDKIAVIEA